MWKTTGKKELTNTKVWHPGEKRLERKGDSRDSRKEIQTLNELRPVLMLREIARTFILKLYFFFLSQLKNMLAYCTVADMIDRITQYPLQPPSYMSPCTAEAGKRKSTFPRCPCS